MKLKYLFGATGFIALLGFIGVFSEEKAFLAFFAFAVDFQYFFVRDDEMWNTYMCRSAARAFCCGMITMALFSFISFLMGKDSAYALAGGLAAGWAAAVACNAVLVAIYNFSAGRALKEDD